MTEDIFCFLKPNAEKLRRYGFRGEDALCDTVEICGGQFLLTVRVLRDGTVETSLTDALTGDPYFLHLVADAVGEFVGEVRGEYVRALREIAERCFDRQVFSSENTLALIGHVQEKYGDEPEYLWEKFPDCAIWRRKDNGKWYGLILTTERKKLGLPGEGKVEILDVRADPDEASLLVDHVRVFPGWHMNKKHWVSLPLDGAVSMTELKEFLEESRWIAGIR